MARYAVGIKTKGLKEVVRALNKIAEDAQDMPRLMHDIGMIAVNAARPPVKTGRLEASMRAGRGKTKAVVRAGRAKVPYAPMIHYGWPKRGIKARPYLTEAIRAQEPAIIARLEQGIHEIVEGHSQK